MLLRNRNRKGNHTLSTYICNSGYVSEIMDTFIAFTIFVKEISPTSYRNML